MGNEKKAVRESFQENLKTLQKCKNSRQTLYYSKGCNSFVGKTYVRLWGTLACACHKYGLFVVITGLLFVFDNKLS